MMTWFLVTNCFDFLDPNPRLLIFEWNHSVPQLTTFNAVKSGEYLSQHEMFRFDHKFGYCKETALVDMFIKSYALLKYRC